MSIKNAADILPMTAAATLIATDVMREMMELIDAGLTVERCDLMEDGELECCAIAYIAFVEPQVPDDWPLDANFWRPTDRRSNWILSQAFMMLEIQRLDRAAERVIGQFKPQPEGTS